MEVEVYTSEELPAGVAQQFNLRRDPSVDFRYLTSVPEDTNLRDFKYELTANLREATGKEYLMVDVYLEGASMHKWETDVTFVVVAPDRTKAWAAAREICETKLKGVATVKAISSEPLKDPEEWIAVNE